MSHSLVPIVKKRLLFRKFEFKKKAAGGCESKACEEMEKKEFNRRLKEPQTSTHIKPFVGNLRGQRPRFMAQCIGLWIWMERSNTKKEDGSDNKV